jgi:hypothetical protein
MNAKVKIEVDARTADLLQARAAARGMSVADLLADLASDDNLLPPWLESIREKGEGPWAPDVLAEDRRRLAEFNRTRMACRGTRSRRGWKAGARRTNCLRPSRVNCEDCRFGCRASGLLYGIILRRMTPSLRTSRLESNPACRL